MLHLVPKVSKLVIFSDATHSTFFPYSLVFDLLMYFDDPKLDTVVKNIFEKWLPQYSDYQNPLDFWVDLESMGEVSVLMAKQLAMVIKDYIREAIEYEVVLLISLNKKITRENQLFIFYLKQSNTVAIDFTQKENYISTVCDYSKYMAWFCIVDFKHIDFHVETALVLKYAWHCASLGAEEVGFSILETAIDSVLHITIKIVYLVQLQFMRIATQYYDEAARENRVPEVGHEEMIESFYVTKAWGNVLTRRIDAAGYYFNRANMTMESTLNDVNCLYKMNIFALYQYLIGHVENALYIENKIKKKIAENSESPQITYVNSISLARLYRYAEEYDSAKAAYDAAFNLPEVIRSETYWIYSNVCYGMLYERQNRDLLALEHWLLATLHWLTAKTPEALGWQAVRVISEPNYKPRTLFDVNGITHSFLLKLIELAEKNQIPIRLKSVKKILFTTEDGKFKNPCIFKFKEITLLASTTKAVVVSELNSYNKLSNLAAEILAKLLGFNGHEFNHFFICLFSR